MKPTVFIMASGDGDRWIGKGPKQLAKINGEPVIVRTQRQVKERTGEDPLVIAWDEAIRAVCKRSHTVHPHRWVAESILSTRPEWGPFNVFLFGDVCFTEDAIDKALEYHGTLKIIGYWDELYGLSFSDGEPTRQILEALEYVVEDAQQGQRGPGLNLSKGKLSRVYRYLSGYRIGDPEFKRWNLRDDYSGAWAEGAIHGGNFIDEKGDDPLWICINDKTDDVDTVEKHAKIQAAFAGE